MDFTYTAWGSAELIVQVLRAVATLVGSGQLAGALAASSLLSLLLLTAAAAFAPSVDSAVAPLRKVVALVVVIGVLLVPTRVTVIDRFAGDDLLQGVAPPGWGATVVAGVPFGVALPASFGSALGSALTRAVETAMAPVDAEDRMSMAGLWLSARALRALLATGGHSDSRLPADFRRFVVNCTYFDIQGGRVDPALLRGGSLVSELGKTAGGITSLPAGADAGGDLVPVSCPTAWSGGASADGRSVLGLRERVERLGRWRKFRACHSLQGISLALTEAQLALAKSAAADPLAGPASSCGDQVFANALERFGFDGSVIDQFREIAAIELMRESSHALSSHEPQALAFASFVSRRQRDAGYVIAGELAALALPGLRGVLEAVVIVLLPVLLVIGMLLFEQFAAYLKNGLLLVVWLQLWPPVMAVINSVGLWVQAAALSEHAIIADGALSVEGSQALLAELDTQLALSRYMLVLVPMISWALVRAGQFSGAMLASRLLQPGEAVASSVSSSVATNSWSADQVSLAPRTSVGPHVATVGDSWGGTTTMHPGLSTVSLPASDPGHLSVSHAQTLAQGLRRHSEQSQRRTDEQREQFSSSLESAYTAAFGVAGSEALRTLRSQGVEDQTSLRALEGARAVISQSEGRTRSVGQQEGSVQTWRLGFDGSAKMSMLMFSAGGTFGQSRSESVSVNESMQRSYSQLDNESKEALRQVSDALQSSDSASLSTTHERATSKGLTSALREAQSHQESYSESLQQSEALSRASEIAHTSGRTVMREMLRDPAQAGLLREMHRLYHAEGLPFEQAWAQAQESSGISMDLDAFALRILESELAPVPTPEIEHPKLRVRSDAHADSERVEALAPQAPAAPAEIAGARERIEAAREAISGVPLPEPGPEHYDEDRRLDRTVVTGDGERMVVPDQSFNVRGAERSNQAVKGESRKWNDEDEDPGLQ